MQVTRKEAICAILGDEERSIGDSTDHVADCTKRIRHGRLRYLPDLAVVKFACAAMAEA
ncbi:MAG TPA: hypothetical protein VMM36_11115 [Opitutaceae bacterium]|nr:hypothetical protein [Opitutaceae bacterium]